MLQKEHDEIATEKNEISVGRERLIAIFHLCQDRSNAWLSDPLSGTSESSQEHKLQEIGEFVLLFHWFILGV